MFYTCRRRSLSISLRFCCVHTRSWMHSWQFRVLWWAWLWDVSEWRKLFCLLLEKKKKQAVFTVQETCCCSFLCWNCLLCCIPVRVCILCWPEQLLDALLCTLNIWLSLQDHLSSDVKTSASHLHFQSVIHKFWLLIVFFTIRGPKLKCRI